LRLRAPPCRGRLPHYRSVEMSDVRPATSARVPCLGSLPRHWFTGAPTCYRCGAPNQNYNPDEDPALLYPYVDPAAEHVCSFCGHVSREDAYMAHFLAEHSRAAKLRKTVEAAASPEARTAALCAYYEDKLRIARIGCEKAGSERARNRGEARLADALRWLDHVRAHGDWPPDDRPGA